MDWFVTPFPSAVEISSVYGKGSGASVRERLAAGR